MKRILFIGLGGIGQRHLRNIRLLLGNDVELIALRRVESDVAEIDNKLSRNDGVNIIEKYSIEVEHSLHRALLRKPDATFICTPSSMHIDYATEAVKAGSHVFVEKPLSNEIKGINELENLAADLNRVVYVGFQLRFNPVIIQLKRLMDAGSVGAITSIRAEVAEFMPGFHKYEDYRRSYASRSELGGGVVLTQIHELDYLQAIFGQPHSVYAVAGSSPSLELDVEDVVDVSMKLKDKERIVPVSLHMDFCQRPTRRSCLVYAERGEIFANLVDRTVIKTDVEGIEEKFSWPNVDRNQQFIDEVVHFLDCVGSSVSPLVNLSEGKKSLLMALAIKQSIALGRPVAI